MRRIRIIVMGKTGVGKSTIINAVIGETLVETGYGTAITRENKVYICKKLVTISKNNNSLYEKVNCEISLYDTVGLEIDSYITNDTLLKIKKHIEEAKRNSEDEDVNIVWFCINEQANRFEEYEANLIKKLSLEYEIPFVIVLTQCISKKQGILARKIEIQMPEVPIHKIMAEDYELDDDIIVKAFGLDELLELSINDYYHYKIKIIESKIDELIAKSDNEIKKIEEKGKACIRDFSEQTNRIGWIPVGCIPVVHGKCVCMISKLNGIGGLSKDSVFADEIFTDIIIGLIATPFMVVPFLSSLVASAYIETIGQGYLRAMIAIVKESTEEELKNTKLMKQKMKEQLEKNKN